jgi:hypothetical protein
MERRAGRGLRLAMPVIKLCPKVILEGTRLTGKTDLALALNESPRITGVRKYRYHSPIVSAEWNGFTRNPYGCSLINFDASYEQPAMEAYRLWVSLFELYRYYSWIIDRFHLSTQMWQAMYRGRRYRFEWLESRLVALGFRVVFCWRDPNSFVEARKRRLQVSSNPSQYDDLTLFIREQKILQELVMDSVIPSLTVDVTDYSLDAQVKYIADWLETTGGLNATKTPAEPTRRRSIPVPSWIGQQSRIANSR